MTKNNTPWIERILGLIEAIFLNLVGAFVVILFFIFYIMPWFMEYMHMKECTLEHTKEFCQKDWQEYDQPRKDFLKGISDSIFYGNTL